MKQIIENFNNLFKKTIFILKNKTNNKFRIKTLKFKNKANDKFKISIFNKCLITTIGVLF